MASSLRGGAFFMLLSKALACKIDLFFWRLNIKTEGAKYIALGPFC